jgi:hypothetical protein
MTPCKLIYLTNASEKLAAYNFRVLQEADASSYETLVSTEALKSP